MNARRSPSFHRYSHNIGFTLIELLIVIAIIAILAVVVVLTLNPAQLLAQSRDANRLSDMATLTNALNLYVTDQTGASAFSLGNVSNTDISIYDPNGSSTCGSLGLPAWNASSGQAWQCAPVTSSRLVNGNGWIPVNFSNISSGGPIGALPVDPVNQTSTGLFYAYNTNGSQFEATANLESQKYKAQYGSAPQTSYFPEVISGGNPTVSALYNPSGLVGYWPLNEGSGSSTIDQSGNGNNGTWTGTPSGNGGTYYTGGKVGAYAGYFNGTNDYVTSSVSQLPLGNASRTLSAWIDLSSYTFTGDHHAGIISWGTGASNNLSSLELDSSGNLTFGGWTFGCNSFVVIPLNNWDLVTATYDGTSLTLYINGSSVTICTAGNLTTASSNLYIGTRGATGGDDFPGLIDDVRVYNRALSGAEIAALYHAQK